MDVQPLQVHEGLVDHSRIDRSFHDLIDAVDHPGTGDALTLVNALADRMRRHLGREDLDIARFASVDAEDARGLLLDHAGFRRTLDLLVANAKAGNLSKADVHDLRLRFSLHEAREEVGLYRWAKAG
jgi:hypothetical protein